MTNNNTVLCYFYILWYILKLLDEILAIMPCFDYESITRNSAQT
jgi:hypothetical protein